TEEFGLTLTEIRFGESRQDALKKLAERADTPEISGFTRAIIQADQLGISLGRILRVQAADTRQRRQAAAEEKAMKAPIKMLIPTVLFIFPAMFLVILGPAFLNLSKIFYEKTNGAQETRHQRDQEEGVRYRPARTARAQARRAGRGQARRPSAERRASLRADG